MNRPTRIGMTTFLPQLRSKYERDQVLPANRPSPHLLRNCSRNLALPFALTLMAFGWAASAQLSPEESLAQLRTAPGLDVSLFAAEPDLVNPTMIDVDAQGRVWVCEAANYRLFNQKETRAEGDRIRVLEDTDGDGTCDKATTFYQDPSLQSPMGIAVLGDRVYVCQAPDLFYLRDTDGDGVADEKTVILTGFGGVDHDHAIHGISFGPDGKLYMSNGDRGLDVTDKSGNRIHAGKDAPIMAATILRTDLGGEHLELLAQGMRNPYEPAVDAFGNVFTSDNDDDGNQQCRINYVMEGGHYGYWPRRRGDRRLDAVHWNEDRPGVVPKMVRTGFGSPCGLLFYDGTLISGVRGTLIHADAGPGVVRSYPYQTDAAGFKSEIVKLLSAEADSWFRPVDVCAAPDGSLFVADWYDPGVGGHRMADVERGRIYRLAPSTDSYENSALDLDTNLGLSTALTSPNQARRFLAFQTLQERVKGGDLSSIQSILYGDDPYARARATWLLPQAGDQGRLLLTKLLRDERATVRVQAVRALASIGIDSLVDENQLKRDSSTQVRRQVLIELARATPEPWMDQWIVALAKQHDGDDRFYREAIGIACEDREEWAYDRLAKARKHVWDDVLADLAIQLHPDSALDAARTALNDSELEMELRVKALWALDAIGSDDAGDSIAAQLNTDAPVELQQTALHLLSRDGGQPWRNALKNADIDVYLSEFLQDSELRSAAFAFVADTERSEFIPQLVRVLQQDARNTETFASALQALEALAPRTRRADRGSVLETTMNLSNHADANVARQALQAAAAVPGAPTVKALGALAKDMDRPLDIRREAAVLMARSKDGSHLLLDFAERGELPNDLQLTVADKLHQSREENIRLMAASVLPRPESREGEALPPLATLIAMRGDAANGKATFFSAEAADCARCHVINGEGKPIGPELSVIGEKLGRDALLESILNPSAAISHEYTVWLIDTDTEGMLSGFVRTESDDALELVDSAGTVTSIKKSDILERRETGTSLMPDGLSATLTAQELVDIVAFLESLK